MGWANPPIEEAFWNPAGDCTNEPIPGSVPLGVSPCDDPGDRVMTIDPWYEKGQHHIIFYNQYIVQSGRCTIYKTGASSLDWSRQSGQGTFFYTPTLLTIAYEGRGYHLNEGRYTYQRPQSWLGTGSGSLYFSSSFSGGAVISESSLFLLDVSGVDYCGFVYTVGIWGCQFSRHLDVRKSPTSRVVEKVVIGGGGLSGGGGASWEDDSVTTKTSVFLRKLLRSLL